MRGIRCDKGGCLGNQVHCEDSVYCGGLSNFQTWETFNIVIEPFLYLINGRFFQGSTQLPAQYSKSSLKIFLWWARSACARVVNLFIGIVGLGLFRCTPCFHRSQLSRGRMLSLIQRVGRSRITSEILMPCIAWWTNLASSDPCVGLEFFPFYSCSIPTIGQVTQLRADSFGRRLHPSWAQLRRHHKQPMRGRIYSVRRWGTSTSRSGCRGTSSNGYWWSSLRKTRAGLAV